MTEEQQQQPGDGGADRARSPTSRAARIAAVVAVAIVLVAAWQLHILERFKEPAQLAQTLVELGAWGYLAFIVAYAALQPFGVPGTIFVFAAPLIWPWPVAFALSMTGTMAASIVGFSFARFVARDAVAKLIPARFKKYDDALEKRAFTTVVILRFIFWMPPLLHAFFGISKVRFWTHVSGSFVGYLVPLFLVSFFGQKVVDWMKDQPPSVWAAFGVSIVATFVGVWLWRRCRRSREPAEQM